MSNREPQTEFFCPKPGDYILIKVPMGPDGYTAEEAYELHQGLVDKFCNNTVITIPADIDLEIHNREELIEFFTNILKQLEDEANDDNLHGRIVPL